MPEITNFTQANSALREYYNNAQTPYTLDVMRQLMAFLGNPQENVQVVHIAGTSGKTSTAYYAAELLKQSGKTVGLFVSPHVDTISERLQTNTALLPETEYCRVLDEFLKLIADCPVKPSYFELLAAMAYWEFARRGLDYAVMEVGLGGLLDATNVVSRADKLCIITDIGLDHTEILGSTIELIAEQKAGIIQPGNWVYMYEQAESVMQVVRSKVERVGAELFAVSPDKTSMPAALPLFQQRNLGLAVIAIASLLNSKKDQLAGEAVWQAAKVVVPARLERFTIGDKTVIIDGSHNQQKLATMLDSLAALYPGQPVAALCAFVSGNDERWQAGLQTILPVAKHIIFTNFHSEQDMPKSSVAAATLQAFCQKHGYEATGLAPEPAEAFEQLIARPEPVLLVTGSFYLLNHIRPLVEQRT